jgi:hypothetical protein
VKARGRPGGAGLPVLGAAAALGVCCTVHLLILAGGVGAVAAVAGRWWPAAAALAAITMAAVATRILRRRSRGPVDRCPGIAGGASGKVSAATPATPTVGVQKTQPTR